MRAGGSRRDRVFKIYVEVPAEVPEEQVMRLIELAVMERIETAQRWEPGSGAAKLDAASVKVLRNSPKYSSMGEQHD